jgi:hypothetical protein
MHHFSPLLRCADVKLVGAVRGWSAGWFPRSDVVDDGFGERGGGVEENIMYVFSFLNGKRAANSSGNVFF